MASSLKVSELNSLNQLTDNDLFLVSDIETSTSRKVTFSTLKNDVTTQLAGVVAQNRQDTEALVETVRAALQLAIGENTSYSTETRSSLTSSDDELQTNIDNLRTYVDGQISSDMWLFSNQSEFPSASDNHGRVVHSHSDGAMFYAHGGQWIEIANKTYVDDKVSSLLDFAPENLDTLNELAEAIGDDSAFITTLNDSITALQADVDQNEADADAAIAALKADVDQNEADADAAIAAENAAMLAAVAAVQSDVDQNEADADAADSALDTRISVLETSIDNLDIDIAPETLNSINELAAAMGDDPTFLTTLQSRVTTIENDNATQTELDAYKAHIEDMNLQLALAYDTPLYVDTLFGG